MTPLYLKGVCGPDMQFLFVNARHPGSSHDSFVLESSALGGRIENRGLNGYHLLGDSG